MTSTFNANQTFREEAREELLPELENALLELGKKPDDRNLVNRVFRALHTLKGSGAMFGFETLSDLAHEMETVFENIRNGLHQANHEMIEIFLTAKDQLQNLINNQEIESNTAVGELKSVIRKMTPPEIGVMCTKKYTGSEVSENEVIPLESYCICFKPYPEILKSGTNPLYLLDELRELGSIQINAHTGKIPLLEEMEPEKCYVWWDMMLLSDSGLNAVKDVFIFVEGDCYLKIDNVSEKVDGNPPATISDGLRTLPLGKRGSLPESSPPGKGNRASVQSALSEKVVEDEDTVTAEYVNFSSDQRSGTDRRSFDSISSMRVQAHKLDHLVNSVGELVIAQTRLSRLAEEKDDPVLYEIAEVMERLTNDLRDNTLDIRMMQIGSSFGKFKRVVWDFSSRSGKPVELITEGASTELDKTVIERLNDPLVHLLRNSIDHGIEHPEDRKKAGKPRQGKIVFSAGHSGGHVIITISDDGRGIDTDLVRSKAIEKGLLHPDDDPSDQELMNIIFEPGFSTAEKISDLSGRGVGMDVVKQNITALKGKIRVFSEKNRGTSVRITIPLTLAIIEGLRVRIGDEYFIVPLSVVSECLEMDRKWNDNVHQSGVLNLRDQMVPFLRLRDWFSINGRRPEKEQVVITAMEKFFVGLVVDEIIGLQQTVIKSLDAAQNDVPGISGATIQGDGSIALIIDIEPLIQEAVSRAEHKK